MKIVASSTCRNFSSATLKADWHSVTQRALRSLWSGSSRIGQTSISRSLLTPAQRFYSARSDQKVVKATIPSLLKKVKTGEKISMITAYDYNQASIIDQSPIDIILVGDSVGMVMLGHDSTIPVEMNDIVHHCKAVSKAAKRPLIVGDLPFGSYEFDINEGCRNAFRLIKEGGVHAIKLEGGSEQIELISRLTKANIAVMGHIGLQPQSVNTLGSYRYVGHSSTEAKRLMHDALALQQAGCFALVLECVPEELSEYITKNLSIPTIGIGAGKHTSGQVLVWHDLLGLNHSCPSFCKKYVDLRTIISENLEKYHEEVVQGNFPDQHHSRKLQNQKTLQMIKEDSLFPDSFSRKQVKELNPLPPSNSVVAQSNVDLSSGSSTEFNDTLLQSSTIHQSFQRILIIGSGAMGMLMAGRIAEGLKDENQSKIVVFDPWYETHTNSIRSKGLLLQSNHESSSKLIKNIHATHDEEEVLKLFDGQKAEVAIILTKSYQLQQQPDKISFEKILAKRGVICSFQNGAGNKQLLQSISRPDQITLIGTTSNGAKVIGDGSICHTGTGPTFIVCKDPKEIHQANRIANLLNQSSIPTQVTDNEEVILEKVIINAAINPISALLEVTNGKIVQESYLLDQIIEKVVEEGVRLRPNLYPDEFSRKKRVKELVAKVKLVATNTAQNRSSMLSDITRGQHTEIDFINGFLVKESLQQGYEAPTNALLTALVKAKASK